LRVDIKSLLSRLNATTQRALEGASGLCVNRGHYEVAIQHMLLDLLEERQSDVALLLRHYEIDPDNWAKLLHREIEGYRDGNPGKPTFAQSLMDWFEDAWLVGSIDVGQSEIRSGTLLLSLSRNAMKFGVSDLPGLSELSEESIRRDFDKVAGASIEASSGAEYRSTSAQSGGDAGAIEKFTTNFTQRAREGKIDPVSGRGREIRQMIDILGRRRKNNPIAVGEPGVGKTAVVEGLALKVAEGDVPDILAGVEIVGLDLGLLQAGASVKGEFEKRLNSVINAIKSSEKPIVLFIDEAHTLIGAGGAAGTGDAANLLKPALARGELRTIAATTWSEYKKYFEKDPALARRFQLVKLDEPSSELAAVILRGIRTIYEDTHDVYVRDEAVAAAAELSARYISGRLLPDKAVDVLDTSCARVKISLTTKPSVIDDLERHIATLERELGALQRDIDSGRSTNSKRQQELETELTENRAKVETETVRWQEELAAVNQVVELRRKVNAPTAEKNDDADSAASTDEGVDAEALKSELNAAIAKVEELQAGDGFIDYEVTKGVVAKVISDWTGV
jgi:type VI secretion system protein VasG